ncbi:zinc-ribbon domain-containing protein [Streptococcus intermedius]
MSDFITDFPALLKYWSFDSNIKLEIEKLPITSKKHVSWKCPNCSYEWKASVAKSYKQVLNHTKICPVCDLGEVLVKGENAISDRFPNFLEYINFHYENIESIQNEIENLTFTSKRLFHFKCPTCHVGWKDVANTSRLLTKKLNKKVVHAGCNEYKHCVPFYKAYPNLGKIYLSGGYNELEFEKLTLSDNVTIPRKWKCDKCKHFFDLSIDKLISRIKRNGFYCTKCEATFDTAIKVNVKPLSYTDKHLLDQLVKNHIKKNMIDCLSNIVATWKCMKCNGEYECSVVKRHQEGCPYCSDKQMLKGYNTLQETHPYLEKFWDKSNDKSISEYWHKSFDVLNWKCPCCNIQFQCSPVEMISRTNLENSNFETCPKNCDWNKLVFNNDIFHNSPRLRKEWSKKNNIPVHLALSHIETKKYWWNCSICQGEYLCSIPIRREVIDSCPYCNDEQPLKGYNTISDIHPELTSYWSSKNTQKIDEITLSEAKNKKYIWLCDCCNLEFNEKLSIVLDKFSNINNRELKKICPYCNKKIPKPEESLGYKKPFLKSEWLENINGDIYNVFSNSNDIIEWICRNCHRNYKAKISNRAEDDKCCPYCSNRKLIKGINDLATTHPHLIKEWSSLNDRQLSYLTNKSSYKAWWNCSVCSNTYQQVVSQKFTSKISCPYCRKAKILKGFNDLPTTHPWLLKEWSTSNDRDFSSLMCNSNYRAWWKCSECSREYRQTVKKKILMNISCCLYCQKNKVLKGFNDLATTHEYLLNEWDYLNNILLAKPTEIDEKSNKIVWWICKDNPNHRYKFKINEKIKYEKRNLITCKICKGLRRKQEHFVQFANL